MLSVRVRTVRAGDLIYLPSRAPRQSPSASSSASSAAPGSVRHGGPSTVPAVGFTGDDGRTADRPPYSTQSPTPLPIAGITRTAVVLLLMTPMAISSAMMPAMVSTGVSPGTGGSCPGHGAHAGHGLELSSEARRPRRRRSCRRPRTGMKRPRDRPRWSWP